MRIGRNEPCPCGSGKKFKRCCGATEDGVRRLRTVAPKGEPVTGWARAHAIWPKTRDALIEHGENWLGLDDFASALTEFPFEIESEDESEALVWSELFCSWQLYDWIPEGEDMTIAEHWLQSAVFDGAAKGDVFRMIQSANEHAFSFFQVQAIDRERGMVLRNLLTGEESFVVDRSTAEAIPPWVVLFARLIEFGGIRFFDSVGYRPLPPDMADPLVRLIEEGFETKTPLSLVDLRQFATDLVEIYSEAIAEFDTRRNVRPVLHTTDGELLVLCKDVWRIEDGKRDEVFTRLEQLGFDSETEHDVTTLRWIRENGADDSLPTTLLGLVTVAANEVWIETHSRERHESLKRNVENAVGALVVHVAHEEKDQAELFSTPPGAGANDEEKTSPKGSIPPEVEREAIQGYLARYYANWPDMKLPALGGKTPRETVKTPSGRSKIEGFLRDMESQSHGSPMEGAYDFNELRKALGLPTS